MSFANIYSAIPDEVKQDFADKILYRIGSLLINENDQIQGFLQSTAGFLEREEVQKMVSLASHYAEMGINTNPVAMGVHAAGSFGVIAYQIVEIKNQLETIEQKVNKIDTKIDIGYYSKFKAAIELASHAFSMKDKENKISMAHQAVQLFVETKNIYAQYIEQELEQDGRMLAEYLLIVILAHIGQVKCCLELEEKETARQILNDNTPKIKFLTKKYIQLLLSENPAIYLHNDFKDLGIDLKKLTKIYNWLGEDTNENQVFNQLREKYIEVHTNQEQAVKEIPAIIWNPILDIAPKDDDSYLSRLNPLTIFRNEDALKPLLKNRLQESFETIQKIVEAYDRFASVKYEVEMFIEQDISYQDWQQKLKEHHQNNPKDDSQLMYIELEKAIQL